MNDDRTLAIIRDRLAEARDCLGEVPMTIPASQIIARAGQRRARRWLISATAACAAAGLTLGLVLPPASHPRPAAGLTVQQLAYRTAAAAAAGPNIRPGQWVYWQEKSAGPADTYRVWTTADSREAAYLDGGKIHTIKPGSCGGAGGGSGYCGFAGQPMVSGGGPSQRGGTLTYLVTHLGVSYAALHLLPHTPQALDRYLAHIKAGAWNHSSAPVREFMIISYLLTSYVMPPALTAELYHSLGDIPSVTVDHHAVDVAGRTGIGFRIRLPKFTGSMVYELIVNPHTYRLMASQGQSGGPATSGIAILRRVLVPGPGVQP